VADIKINEKLVVSQTGTAEPVLASNVDINTSLASATIPAAGITGTLGSGVTFPSGCVIGGAMLERFNVTNYISSTSTSFVDSGVWGSYTPVKSSSVTRLKIHFHIGFSQAQNYLTYHTCGMDSSNSTTYASATSLDATTYMHRNVATEDRTFHSTWDFIQTTSGRVSATFPSSISSYSAGTPYYFRLYYKVASGGTYYFGHIGTQLAFWIEEIML
jgi:hypothetical protein